MIYAVDTDVMVHATMVDLPHHGRVRRYIEHQIMAGGHRIAVAQQIIAEFVHVSTDARRFEVPLTMNQALEQAEWWLGARETQFLPTSQRASERAVELLSAHRLGRKRILDTAFVALLEEHRVGRLLTMNVRHYRIFGLELHNPARTAQ